MSDKVIKNLWEQMLVQKPAASCRTNLWMSQFTMPEDLVTKEGAQL